ncbi:MAG: helix-turn-helix transcriptional regulator [Desulfobulbaceae bacterium]|nr:helix-turn-helix transcriptional regulator [Desulfobulbaceae bacterium]
MKSRYIMLALVKKPRIELSIQGEHVDEFIDWIKKKFEVTILSSKSEDSIPVEETDFWKEMQSNRVGNLLAGARLKADLTQAQLAEKLNVRQNMISDYERGKRRLSPAMAKRMAQILNIKMDRLS